MLKFLLSPAQEEREETSTPYKTCRRCRVNDERPTGNKNTTCEWDDGGKIDNKNKYLPHHQSKCWVPVRTSVMPNSPFHLQSDTVLATLSSNTQSHRYHDVFVRVQKKYFMCCTAVRRSTLIMEIV